MHIRTVKKLLFVFFTICFLSFKANALEDITQKITFKENTGGLNSKASPVTLGDNESSDLLNIDLDTDGAIKKRSGYTQLNTTAVNTNNIDGLYSYNLNNGTRYLIAAANAIYKMDALDGTWDTITGSTTITANTKARFATYQNTLFITNNVDKVQEWSGTSTCADSQCNGDISLSKAKFMAPFSSRLFLAHVTVSSVLNPSRVYYCNFNDKDAWVAGNYITVGYDDGDIITGLAELGGNLYVFKKKSIYKIASTGDSNTPFSVEKTNATEGCIAPDSIQIINTGMMIYLSQQGLCLFDGNKSEVVSYKIKPTIDALEGANLINASSVIFKELNQYWLSVSDGDSGDRIIVWDYYHQAFLFHSGINANSLCTIIDSAENERLYFGDFNGLVYRANVGVDDYPAGVRTAINSYYTTKHYDFGSLFMTKKPRYLVVIFQYSTAPSSLNVSYSYDLQTTLIRTETIELQNPTTSAWDVSIWDVAVWSGSGATYNRVDLQSQGITQSFKFSNNSLGQTFSIYGWEVAYDMGVHVEN